MLKTQSTWKCILTSMCSHKNNKKENIMNYFTVLIKHLSGGKTDVSVRITCLQAKNQTYNLSNMK
jgi:hypothetical protein